MNKEEILDILREYNFDKNEYMVISSASLVVQGIKESTKDIDIAVSEEYYNYLINNYNVEFEKENLGVKVYYINRVINFNTNSLSVYIITGSESYFFRDALILSNPNP